MGVWVEFFDPSCVLVWAYVEGAGSGKEYIGKGG
jgi:hypothetical protein